MVFITSKIIETPEEEAARLDQCPVGSRSHELSLLPVTVEDPSVRGLIIRLPRNNSNHDGDRSITVVAYAEHPFSRERVEGEKIRRYNSSWDCIVVHSTHPSYPVDGYDICVSEAELRRGTVVAVG